MPSIPTLTRERRNIDFAHADSIAHRLASGASPIGILCVIGDSGAVRRLDSAERELAIVVRSNDSRLTSPTAFCSCKTTTNLMRGVFAPLCSQGSQSVGRK